MPLDPNRLVKPVKKLKKLINRIDREPTPDDVHDLRTNTRQFEALFGTLTMDDNSVGNGLLKKLIRFRKRAGKVRDMDVLTTHASTVHVKGEEDCLAQLLEHLGAQRLKFAKRLHVEVKRHRPAVRGDLKRAPSVLSKQMREDPGDSNKSPLAVGATGTAVELAIKLADPQHLGRGNLHPYRLKVKELRSLLQMGAGAGHLSFLDDLKEVKDAIGEWHDCDVLVSIAQKILDHGTRCGLIAELKLISETKYEHALALAETLRSNHLRKSGSRGRKSTAKIPGDSVWEAIAMLA